MHVVEMHQLVLDNMKYQHEEIQDLKQILGQMQGTAVERTQFAGGRDTDLRALHPRGRTGSAPTTWRGSCSRGSTAPS